MQRRAATLPLTIGESEARDTIIQRRVISTITIVDPLSPYRSFESARNNDRRCSQRVCDEARW